MSLSNIVIIFYVILIFHITLLALDYAWLVMQLVIHCLVCVTLCYVKSCVLDLFMSCYTLCFNSVNRSLSEGVVVDSCFSLGPVCVTLQMVPICVSQFHPDHLCLLCDADT